jgi:inhibitor of cysteine peptidase
MSPLLSITALSIAILLPGAACSAEEIIVPVGSSYPLELEGNPSTGYSWRLDAAKSENAAIVEVENRGYVPGGGDRVGAPAPYRFQITGIEEGSATLVFEYLQVWVGEPVKTEERTVRVVAP